MISASEIKRDYLFLAVFCLQLSEVQAVQRACNTAEQAVTLAIGDNSAHCLLLWLTLFYQQSRLWQILCFCVWDFRRKVKVHLLVKVTAALPLCPGEASVTCFSTDVQSWRFTFGKETTLSPRPLHLCVPQGLNLWPGSSRDLLFLAVQACKSFICSQILLTW